MFRNYNQDALMTPSKASGIAVALFQIDRIKEILYNRNITVLQEKSYNRADKRE